MRKILMVLALLVLFAKNVSADNTNSMNLQGVSSQYLSIASSSLSAGFPGKSSNGSFGDFSIEFYYKPTVIGVDGDLISKALYNTGTSYALYVNSTNHITLIVSNNGTQAGSNSWITNNAVITSIVWRHIGFTYNAAAGTAVIYINGSAVASTKIGSAGTTVHLGTGQFEIGGNNWAGTYGNGLFDEVRVWTDIRTAQEMMDNYQKELIGNEAGLVGYWKFNGNTSDSTANGNNLTNNNGAVFSADVPFVGTSTPPPPPPAAICSIQGNLISVTSIPDISGNNIPETVTLGVDSATIPTVCIYDVSTTSFVKEIKFFFAGWMPKSAFITPDMSTPLDGTGEVSVMATNGTQTKIQIKDTKTGSLIKENTLP